MKRITGFLGVFVIAAIGTAAAGATSDQALRAAAETKLAESKLTNGGGPQVTVVDGVVTLKGTARSLWAKTEATALVLGLDGVVAVEDELSIAAGESDAVVAEAVAKEIRRYPFFTVYDDVNIAVEEGNVALTGRVTMPFKSEEIEKRISKVMGVNSIANGIQTLPTNIGDQRIRANLAYRLYSDSLFRQYAFRANPPIHIIVERGRVALTGAVRSEVERVAAEHIARQTFGVFGVENRLTVGD